MNLYERIRQMDDEFAAMADEFAQAFASIPEPEGLAMLDEAVRAARGAVGSVRVVVDTSVLLSGLMHPNSTPGRIVAAWRNAAFELVLTRAQLTEIARVLSYPKIARVLRWDPERSERYRRRRASEVGCPAS